MVSGCMIIIVDHSKLVSEFSRNTKCRYNKKKFSRVRSFSQYCSGQPSYFDEKYSGTSMCEYLSLATTPLSNQKFAQLKLTNETFRKGLRFAATTFGGNYFPLFSTSCKRPGHLARSLISMFAVCTMLLRSLKKKKSFVDINKELHTVFKVRNCMQRILFHK